MCVYVGHLGLKTICDFHVISFWTWWYLAVSMDSGFSDTSAINIQYIDGHTFLKVYNN